MDAFPDRPLKPNHHHVCQYPETDMRHGPLPRGGGGGDSTRTPFESKTCSGYQKSAAQSPGS